LSHRTDDRHTTPLDIAHDLDIRLPVGKRAEANLDAFSTRFDEPVGESFVPRIGEDDWASQIKPLKVLPESLQSADGRMI
jgi:hypothetical protein